MIIISTLWGLILRGIFFFFPQRRRRTEKYHSLFLDKEQVCIDSWEKKINPFIFTIKRLYSMAFFLYIAQKRLLVSVDLAISEMEHFMSDIKVIQKFQSKIPGIRKSDIVESTLQFPQGACLILFPSTWQILFLISVLLHLNAKINAPITLPSLKERGRKVISGPCRELCQEDLMASLKPCHNVYSGLGLIRSTVWSFNLKKMKKRKEKRTLTFLSYYKGIIIW